MRPYKFYLFKLYVIGIYVISKIFGRNIISFDL